MPVTVDRPSTGAAALCTIRVARAPHRHNAFFALPSWGYAHCILAIAPRVKKKLIICFRHNKVRTFGSFIRESDKSKGGHYVFKELSKA